MSEEPIEGVVVSHPIPQVHWAFDFGPGGQVYVGKAYTAPTADGTWTLIGYTEEGVKFA